MLTYKNIVDGVEIIEDVNVFDKRQKNSIKEFDNFIILFSNKVNLSTIFDSYKLSNKKESFITFKINNLDYRINLVLLKNSGVANVQNKRIQLKPKHYFSNTNNYFFGILNIGKTTLYTISANTNNYLKRYVNNKKDNGSYSSYWYSYNDIKDIALNNKQIIKNQKGDYISTDLNLLIDEYYNDINNNENNLINENNESFKFDDDLFDYVDFESEIDEVADFDQENIQTLILNNKLIRDKDLINQFLINNQFCYGCGITKTFKKRDEKLMYFEIHHFIPYNANVQKNFKKTLDSKLNLVSLCSNCHKKIHLAEFQEREKLINLLAKKICNENFLKVYPEFDLNKLILIYEELYKKG